MRKKLMSLIVATAFILSIASPAVFAAPSTSGEGTSNEGSSSSILKNEGTTNARVAPSDDYVDGIVGRITKMFNYSAGIMTSLIDANFNITVLDNGRQRATFGYNFENATYTMTSFNLYGTDFGKINEYLAANGGDKAAAMKAFLSDIGLSKTQLTTEKADYKDGKYVPKTTDDTAREEIDVAWLAIAFDTLASGTNFSCSINTVAAGGSTLTTMINGQPDKVYAAQPGEDGKAVVTQEYNYENGFLKSITSLAYEVDLKSLKEQKGYDKLVEDGIIDPKKTNEQYASKDELINAMDSQGTGSVKYNATHNTVYLNAYGQQSYTTNAKGTVLGTYSYSSNGAINSYKDLTNNTTTQYVNGSPTNVINDKGYITQSYMYNTNGTMSGAATYNDGVMTTLTAYRMGKALATADLSKGVPATIQSISAAYDSITKPGKTVDEINAIVQANNLTNIQLYSGHLLNKNLLVALGFGIQEEINKLQKEAEDLAGKISDEEFQKLITAVEKYNKAESEDAKTIAFNEIFTGSYGGKLGNIIAQLKALGVTSMKDVTEYLKNATRYVELKDKVDKGGKLSSEISDEEKQKGKTVSDQAFYDSYSNKSTDVSRYITQLIMAFNKIINLSPKSRQKQVDHLQLARDTMFKKNNGYSAVASITPTINTVEEAINSTSTTSVTSADGRDVTSSANSYKNSSSADGYSGDALKATEKTTTTTTMKKTTTLNYTVTVFDRGAAAFEIKGAEHILDQSTYDTVSTSDKQITYDPAIIGELAGFVGADGKALLNDDGTAMTNEQIAQYRANGGVVYAALKASDVNIMDGQGFQAVDGEEILVQITDDAVFNELANNVGKEVMLMGDVTNDVDGKKTIVMNLSYGGGYQVGAGVAQMKEVIQKIEAGDTGLSAQNAWVQQNLDANSWLSGISGSLDAKWNLLVMNGNSGGALEKKPRALLQIMSAAMTIF